MGSTESEKEYSMLHTLVRYRGYSGMAEGESEGGGAGNPPRQRTRGQAVGLDPAQIEAPKG